MNHRTEILPGVYLTAVQSDKFKTGCFSLNLLRPMKKEEAAANALIPSVLLRGSETCPDIASISAKLDELYGASVGTLVRKKGEVQLVGFQPGNDVPENPEPKKQTMCRTNMWTSRSSHP